ncbi:MAG: choice-of-anchor Q domain-containing protein, partial [Bacteroidota bacterium]
MKKTIDFFWMAALMICQTLWVITEANAQCPTVNRLYVNQIANGLNNGSSWNDAYTDLQDALATANSCSQIQEIWVAEGIYIPAPAIDPSYTFELVSGVAMYGGFDGAEVNISQRDFKGHPTILSGNLGTDYSHHVVTGTDLNNSTIFDGFIIREGKIESFDFVNSKWGAGMIIQASSGQVCNPVIRNTSFEFNIIEDDGLSISLTEGGALSIVDADPTIENCWFLNNSAGNNGGAVYIEGTKDAKFSSCYFIGNTSADFGGAMASISPNLFVENCVFGDNFADNQGGGAIAIGPNTHLTATNCTFHANRADDGIGASIRVSGSAFITNSIFWGNGARNADPFDFDANVEGNNANTLIENCIYQGGWIGAGSNNIDQYPEFVGEFSHDYRLRSNSPARNTGNSTYATNLSDLQGNSRIQENIVDMGALEFSPVCSSISRVYVDKNASGSGDGSSWVNAYQELSDALTYANSCNEVQEVWVAQGSYSPITSSMEMFVYRTSVMGASFHIRKDLKVYGGFAGNESSLSERNLPGNHSILEGEIGNPATTNDNSLRIVSISQTNANSILDGFIIQHNADGSYTHKDPNDLKIASISSTLSGIYAAFISDSTSIFEVSNCIFRELTEGGIFSKLEDLTITNTSFLSIDGWGVYTINGKWISPSSLLISGCYFHQINGSLLWLETKTTITDSEFFQNTAGIYADKELSIERCIFRENQPSNNRPIIRKYFSSPLLISNSLFAQNVVGETGTIFLRHSPANIVNST